MSIPDEFFKTESPEGTSKAPYATTLAIIAIVALVAWAGVFYMNRQVEMEKQSKSGISQEEKQAILDSLAKGANTDAASREEGKRQILNSLSSKSNKETPFSEEDRQEILNSLQSGSR